MCAIIKCALPFSSGCEIQGQIFTECGTACPAVCGEERPLFCTMQCVIGCQCPSETYLDRTAAQCVTECPIGIYTELIM